jgi:hypothetical protein
MSVGLFGLEMGCALNYLSMLQTITASLSMSGGHASLFGLEFRYCSSYMPLLQTSTPSMSG